MDSCHELGENTPLHRGLQRMSQRARKGWLRWPREQIVTELCRQVFQSSNAGFRASQLIEQLRDLDCIYRHDDGAYEILTLCHCKTETFLTSTGKFSAGQDSLVRGANLSGQPGSSDALRARGPRGGASRFSRERSAQTKGVSHTPSAAEWEEWIANTPRGVNPFSRSRLEQ